MAFHKHKAWFGMEIGFLVSRRARCRTICLFNPHACSWLEKAWMYDCIVYLPATAKWQVPKLTDKEVTNKLNSYWQSLLLTQITSMDGHGVGPFYWGVCCPRVRVTGITMQFREISSYTEGYVKICICEKTPRFERYLRLLNGAWYSCWLLVPNCLE